MESFSLPCVLCPGLDSTDRAALRKLRGNLSGEFKPCTLPSLFYMRTDISPGPRRSPLGCGPEGCLFRGRVFASTCAFLVFIFLFVLIFAHILIWF